MHGALRVAADEGPAADLYSPLWKVTVLYGPLQSFADGYERLRMFGRLRKL
jgi:hypothetical protein